jgi:hypothetical protein
MKLAVGLDGLELSKFASRQCATAAQLLLQIFGSCKCAPQIFKILDFPNCLPSNNNGGGCHDVSR